MNKRKKSLLSLIIGEYTKNIEPVGSKFLVEKHSLGISPATLRNEMAELEKEEYICQPHISAGRVPTGKGYRFYVENILTKDKLAKREEKFLKQTIKQARKLNLNILKELAKTLSDLSSEMVFIGFAHNDFYYTGLANLFQKPEFHDVALACTVGEVIDNIDKIANDIFDPTTDEIKILIGKDNPFGDFCGTILTNYHQKRKKGILGFLGPMRMDYQNNYSLIKSVQKLINNL